MCGEFAKRINNDLPFYYHTSTHHRFQLGDMPSFSIPSLKEPRKKRVTRRELLSDAVGGRVTMAQRGAGSVRATFHNVPVDLPPPPSHSGHVHTSVDDHIHFKSNNTSCRN